MVKASIGETPTDMASIGKASAGTKGKMSIGKAPAGKVSSGKTPQGKASELANPSATREILDRFDLAPKKSFGQNFLINDGIIQKILNLSEVSSDDVVLEVGPGIGTLTTALLKKASFVIAIERDPDLPKVLNYTLQNWEGRYRIIKKDALDLESSDFEATDFESVSPVLPNKFIANLPYSVAATLVLDYFWRFESLQSATVMVQKEVADRMMAKVGTKNYGAYTVKLSMIAEPVDTFLVKPDNFMPRPHVDSAVIRLDRISQFDDFDDDAAHKLIEIACIMADAAFFSRRKTIANSMRTYLSANSSGGRLDRSGRSSLCSSILERLPQLFEIAAIDPGIRGERLSKQDYLNLASAFMETV